MASGRAHRGVGRVGVEHDDLGPAKVAEQALGRLELLAVRRRHAREEGERLGVAQVRVGRGVRHERHLLHAWNHSTIGEETRPSETGCQQAVVRLTGDARDDHRLRGAARADRAVQRPAPVAQLLDEVFHGEGAVAAGLRPELDLQLRAHEYLVPHAVAVVVDHLGRAQELGADLHVVVEQPADEDLRFVSVRGQAAVHRLPARRALRLAERGRGLQEQQERVEEGRLQQPERAR